MTARATRRDFLGKTSVAAATWAAGTYAAGADATLGPNETINLGLIGCGGEGRAVMQAHQACSGTRIVAVCDVHAARMAQARKEAGGDQVLAYHDYRELLDNKDIDAVIVATNGHWHALPSIHACQAGKDVYVEKPLATSIGEGRAVVRAARRYNRIVQIGTQQHSWPHYQSAVKAIQSGKLGEISEVKVWDYDYMYPGFGNPSDGDPPKELDWDFWLGPSTSVPYNPNRYQNHYWFFDYAGAWQLDWAVHHYDIVHWALGVTAPQTATACGAFSCFEETNIEWPDTFSGICQYGPGPVAKKGFIMQYTFRGGCRREHSGHGKCFFGTEASLWLYRGGYIIQAEARNGNKLGTVIEREKNAFTTNLHIESLSAHAKIFLNALRTRKRPPTDVETGHFASNPGHLMNIAWKVDRKIHWDAEKEQVLDDDDANALVTKAYRAPWKLEV
jgi:predicted dehydrogenase